MRAVASGNGGENLRLLRHLGLVIGEREGRRTIYELRDEHIGVLLAEAVFHVEHVRLGYAAASRRRTRRAS